MIWGLYIDAETEPREVSDSYMQLHATVHDLCDEDKVRGWIITPVHLRGNPDAPKKLEPLMILWAAVGAMVILMAVCVVAMWLKGC